MSIFTLLNSQSSSTTPPQSNPPTPFTQEQMIVLSQLLQFVPPPQLSPQSNMEKYSPYFILGASMVISAIINWYGLKEDITKLHSSVEILMGDMKEQKTFNDKIHVIDKDISVMRSQLDTHFNKKQ